ncbi:MAG: haloacid dehalogenase-like hydrolase [Bacilli bacterium]|nr:haloacid dehalogenase-like hydrolase [Bacilli bacterium]
MYIYDFDDTIYDGDTNKDIIKYGLKKHFKITLKALLKAKKLNKEYKRGMIEFERVKEAMLSFIYQTPNADAFITMFVEAHLHKIKPWYINKRTENDVVISASYEIWIKEFCKHLGIKTVIATRTDEAGNILGKNCKGQEKINRLFALVPDAKVAAMYSDSSCDIPLFDLAERGYVVEGQKISTYYKGYKFKNNK